MIPPDPDLPSPEERGYSRLFDAVEAASEEEPLSEAECNELGCSHTQPLLYLFDSDSLQPIGEPAQREEDLRAQFPGDELPDNSRILEVPVGVVVVEDKPPDDPDTEEDESETGATSEFFVLRDEPGLTGDEIEDPKQGSDQTTGQPNVTFEFTDEGRAAFQEVTREIAIRGQENYFEEVGPGGLPAANVADQFSDSFAIVLDNELVSRPIINFVENPDGIDGRTGAQISGLDSLQESQDLAEVLRIGALPINLVLISQSTVSATLGEQALDQGLIAGLAGLAIVLVFLLLYYRFLGLIAGLGLLVYAVFFFALIKLIPITLTLPGIAGLILTIGVAADSNIVIFERIKEEVRAGRSMISAISEGYKKGIATIIDANVITLLTAFILFVLATAGVKGFAFTLGIGVIVSLFTAVLFTQAILGLFGRSRILRSPRFLGAAGEGPGWSFDFTRASKWFFSMSGLILAIGSIAFATKQLNLGIDFESGTRIQAALAEPATVDEIREALVDADIEGSDTAKIQDTENPDFGENVVQIQADIPADQADNVQPVLEDAFGLEGGEQGYDSTSIGPTFGEQIARSAVIAIIFSLLVIAAYVALRFEAKYAVPVLIALDPRHPDHRRRLRPPRRRGLIRDGGGVPDHPRLLDVRHDHRLRPHPRERAADAARRLLPDRQPLDERGPDALADHRPLDRVPDRDAARLRRRDPARLRARDDDRGRLRYVLLDLHRLAGADRVEGARAGLPLPPRAADRGDGPRAHLPRGQRRRQDRRGRAPRRIGGEARGRTRPRLRSRRRRWSDPRSPSRPPRRRGPESPVDPRSRPSAPRARRDERSRPEGNASGGRSRWRRSSGSPPVSRSGTSRSSSPTASGPGSSARCSARAPGR